MTLSWIRWTGYTPFVQTIDLIPDQPTERYRPSQYDPLPRGRLWSPDRFPELWKLWQSARPHFPDARSTFYEGICKQLAQSPIGTFDRSSQSVSVATSGPGVELRVYLWYFFKHVCCTLIEARTHTRRPFPVDWPWNDALSRLLQAFRCTFVSFNYDNILENVLEFRLRTPIVAPAHNSSGWYHCYNCPKQLVLKPHGCVHFYAPAGGYCGAGWWLNREGGPVVWTGGNCMTVRHEVPDSIPLVPLIVPPGHTDRHYLDPVADISQTVHQAFSDADAIVCAGLSCGDADKEEFLSYCGRAHRNIPVVHVGLTNDAQGNCHTILRNLGGDRYRFILADTDPSSDRIVGIPDMINLLIATTPQTTAT
ncbi:MAG: hypothetical protein KF768_05925 [Phycisphaeraceae bacterium]|nr:hypothetical protein [Phycisphaeraceae bacterium]